MKDLTSQIIEMWRHELAPTPPGPATVPLLQSPSGKPSILRALHHLDEFHSGNLSSLRHLYPQTSASVTALLLPNHSSALDIRFLLNHQARRLATAKHALANFRRTTFLKKIHQLKAKSLIKGFSASCWGFSFPLGVALATFCPDFEFDFLNFSLPFVLARKGVTGES